jgi:hypothetical protein
LEKKKIIKEQDYQDEEAAVAYGVGVHAQSPHFELKRKKKRRYWGLVKPDRMVSIALLALSKRNYFHAPAGARRSRRASLFPNPSTQLRPVD